jgi:hypothetical protein
VTSEPILIMAFNRPDHLQVLINRLREVKPTKIYAAIDGPRQSRADERHKVEACRALIASIDWNCEVKTQYQEENLGCGLGVSTAISWFFTHEERGIILEDDIIPHPSFFPYCTELLNRYANDDRVFAISGCNFVPRAAQTHPENPYRFSQVPHIWGWATWRRAWKNYDFELSNIKSDAELNLDYYTSHKGLIRYWKQIFLFSKKQVFNTWDYQWVYTIWKNNVICIVPKL